MEIVPLTEFLVLWGVGMALEATDERCKWLSLRTLAAYCSLAAAVAAGMKRVTVTEEGAIALHV